MREQLGDGGAVAMNFTDERRSLAVEQREKRRWRSALSILKGKEANSSTPAPLRARHMVSRASARARSTRKATADADVQ